MRVRSILSGVAMAMIAASATAQISGEDHPLLPRFGDASLRNYRAPAEDRVAIPVARVDDQNSTTAIRTIEGRVTHIDYAVPRATPTLAVGRYYTGLLERAGYRVVLDCTGEATCGEKMGALIFLSDRVAPTGFADGLFGNRMRVITAERDGNWVMLHLFEGPDRTTIYEVVVDRG